MTASNMTSSTSASSNINANNTTNTSTNATNRSSTLSIKSIIEDAMQEIQNNDTSKALERMNLADQQLSTAGNTTSIQEVKVFIDDAIQLLQHNHDVNTALVRLKLADQHLGAQSVQTTSGNATGNSTIILKLGNKAYPIKYQLIGGKLTAISAEKDNLSLLLKISSTSNGKLTIELPRYVIDSKKQGNVDDNYAVFVDGQYTAADEIRTTAQARTLMVGFDNGTSVIEITGTTWYQFKIQLLLNSCNMKIPPMQLKCSIHHTGVLKVPAIHLSSHHSIHKQRMQAMSQYK